jgi:hypothetical protein
MGFMGLSHWSLSDNAFDFRVRLLATMAKSLAKELLEDANCYNTPGYINVALVMEDPLFSKMSEYDRSYFHGVTHDTIRLLTEALKDDDLADEHKVNMKRMKKHLEKWIKGVEP